MCRVTGQLCRFSSLSCSELERAATAVVGRLMLARRVQRPMFPWRFHYMPGFTGQTGLALRVDGLAWLCCVLLPDFNLTRELRGRMRVVENGEREKDAGHHIESRSRPRGAALLVLLREIESGISLYILQIIPASSRLMLSLNTRYCSITSRPCNMLSTGG